MQTVNIHEAKTQLSKLVDGAVKGDSFIIAKAGKPLVMVSRLEAPAPAKMKRIGFMQGQFSVPDDFDTLGTSEIANSFNDES